LAIVAVAAVVAAVAVACIFFAPVIALAGIGAGIFAATTTAATVVSVAGVVGGAATLIGVGAAIDSAAKANAASTLDRNKSDTGPTEVAGFLTPVGGKMTVQGTKDGVATSNTIWAPGGFFSTIVPFLTTH
jgi:hypothetical protein